MENRMRKFGDADQTIQGGPGSAGFWFDSVTEVFKINPGTAAVPDVKSFVDVATAKTVTAFAADGAITFAGTQQIEVQQLTKGSAGAYTLAAPTAAQEGKQLIVTSASAFAHVITATGLLEDGITGGAKNTATFGAFKGATLHLVAINLKWHVVSKNVVTIAA